MNSETSDTMGTMGMGSGSTGSMGTSGSGSSGSGSSSGANANVERVAQKAHETVDRLQQTLTSGTERMMSMQEEYGEMAREQIRANPLGMVVGAFAVGYILAKITR